MSRIIAGRSCKTTRRSPFLSCLTSIMPPFLCFAHQTCDLGFKFCYSVKIARTNGEQVEIAHAVPVKYGAGSPYLNHSTPARATVAIVVLPCGFNFLPKVKPSKQGPSDSCSTSTIQKLLRRHRLGGWPWRWMARKCAKSGSCRFGWITRTSSRCGYLRAGAAVEGLNDC